MPIKLLHHKSWHVYSQENIARVKRDEALAAAEQDSQTQRTLLADSEARIDRMKASSKKRKKREGDEEGEKELERQLKGKKRDDQDRESAGGSERREEKGIGREKEKDERMMSGGHLNFWAHLEGTSGAGPSNADLEKRIDKASKQTKESELDALTKVYLAKRGEGEPKGWYASEDGKTERERKEGEEATLERTYRDNETKRLVDPLALMNSYLKRREDVKSGNITSQTRRQPSSRDRYIEPTTHAASPSSSRLTETPRSSHSRREDDLEPIVTKLLGSRRRRGDPLPPPPPSPPRNSSSASTMAPPASTSSQDPRAEALQRTSSERARTAALLAARRKAAMSSSASSVASTPRSEYGAQEGGFGMFNREEVKEAKLGRMGGRGGWGEKKERRNEREREGGWGRRR